MNPGHLLALAAMNGLAATTLAAMAAHALPAEMPRADKDLFALAADFHMILSLAIAAVSALAAAGAPKRLSVSAALLFQAGALTFSGSLYIRSLMGAGSLGGFHWVTPIGGFLMMAGWISLVIAGLRWKHASKQ